MLSNFLKHNSVLLTFFALYLIVVALALVVIDKQAYQQAKKSLIIQNPEHYIYHLMEGRNQRLTDLALSDLSSPNSTLASSPARQELLHTIREIMDGPSPVYQIEVIASTS